LAACNLSTLISAQQHLNSLHFQHTALDRQSPVQSDWLHAISAHCFLHSSISNTRTVCISSTRHLTSKKCLQEKVAGILTALGVTAIVANQNAARVSGPAARRAGLSTKAGTLVTCDKCPGGFREALTALLRPSAGHERGAAHHPHIVLVGFQSAKRGTNFATLDHTVSLTHQWLVSAQDGGCWEGLAQSLRCMGVKPEKADPVKVWASEDIMDAIGRGYDAANWICRQARSGGANSNTVRAAAEYARQTETLNVRYGRSVGKDIKTSQKKRLSASSTPL
jgi:hypothetical protein